MSNNITKAFVVEVLKKDGTTEKMNFGDLMFSKHLLPIVAKTEEFDALTPTHLISLSGRRGKVDVMIKPEAVKYLESNDITKWPGATEAKITQLSVNSQEKVKAFIVPNWDKRLSNGRLGSFLAQHSANLMKQFKLDALNFMYGLFDETTENKTKIVRLNSGGTALEEVNIPALDSTKTIAKNIEYLKAGGRNLNVKLAQLNTTGNFLKLFDNLIEHIEKLPNNPKLEYLPRRMGAITRDQIKIFIDAKYAKYFKENNNLLLPANAKQVDSRTYQYNGVKIIFKTLGSKPIYVVVDGTYDLYPVSELVSEVSGGAGLAAKSVTGIDRVLAVGEKIFTMTCTTKYIRPDALESLIWSIEFSA